MLKCNRLVYFTITNQCSHSCFYLLIYAQELYTEALYMTEKLDNDPKPSPFDLTRRGVIYRKVSIKK